MFDEYQNVHKLPFSLYSCFINETLGASWQGVEVYRKLNTNTSKFFSNEGEVTSGQTRVLTSAA